MSQESGTLLQPSLRSIKEQGVSVEDACANCYVNLSNISENARWSLTMQNTKRLNTIRPRLSALSPTDFGIADEEIPYIDNRHSYMFNGEAENINNTSMISFNNVGLQNAVSNTYYTIKETDKNGLVRTYRDGVSQTMLPTLNEGQHSPEKTDGCSNNQRKYSMRQKLKRQATSVTFNLPKRNLRRTSTTNDVPAYLQKRRSTVIQFDSTERKKRKGLAKMALLHHNKVCHFTILSNI